MNQSTSKPRFTVRRKPSKSGRGEWAVCDRTTRRVDSRYCYESSAVQVAESLNAIERDRLADGLWPLATYSERWTLVTREVAPAEAEAIEEPSEQDRRDWAAMSNQGDDHDGTLLASLDDNLSAFLDRVGADYLERDIPECELVEFGVIARR